MPPILGLLVTICFLFSIPATAGQGDTPSHLTLYPFIQPPQHFLVEPAYRTYNTLPVSAPSRLRANSFEIPGIALWPIGKQDNSATSGSQGVNPSGNVSGADQASGGESSSSERAKKGNGGRDTQQNQPPLFPLASKLTGKQSIYDYIVIVVNERKFHINKEQLIPSRRGQEEASTIKVIDPSCPEDILTLDEVESIAAVPAQFKLSKVDEKTLNYMLTYGTRATKKALQHHYPLSLISEQGGHLVTAANYRGYLPDAICEICQEPLLSRDSLSHCDHPGKHTFHTNCLSRWLQQKVLFNSPR